MSVAEASERWGVSPRQVQRLLAGKRIPGARKYGRSWMVPADAEKPLDPRRENTPPSRSLSADLVDLIAATTLPMPEDDPYDILHAVKEERLRLQYQGELAYLRGDFSETLGCYHRTEGDTAARLRASMMAVAAAISLGDYRTYTQIERYLKGWVKAEPGSDMAFIAELALASVAVSVTAPHMVPDWLKDGDFSARPVLAAPYTFYLRAKYFQCIGRYDAMLAVAQTALALSPSKQGMTFPDIYLRVICAIACHHLERDDEARRWLLRAMHLCLPQGFISPFAEVVTQLGGLVEWCLEREFPEHYDAVIGQWKRTVKNWITFHNQFTKDNITLILSLREYHIAIQVARHVPYAKIAEQHCISVGRLKNIVLEIYEKLYISSRDELARYVI